MWKMCGMEDMSGNKCFPKWCRDLFAKHQDEKDKAQVIATAVDKYYIFENSEVALYPTLVKTIVKRDWAASNTGKRAALVNAGREISRFATVDLTEEYDALIQQDN